MPASLFVLPPEAILPSWCLCVFVVQNGGAVNNSVDDTTSHFTHRAMNQVHNLIGLRKIKLLQTVLHVETKREQKA